MRILIVEDEALIAMALAECLEGAGHLVTGPASTMTEALALCEVLPPELALLDGVARVARRRHGHLRLEDQGVAVQQPPQRGALLHRVAERRRADPHCRALHLHPGLHQRAVVAENEREADQPFPADHPDLDLLAVLQRGEERRHAAFGEQHGVDLAVRREEGPVEG